MHDLLNLNAFLDSLKRRWFIPLSFLFVAAAISYGITGRLPKVFRASTLILVEPQKIPVAYVRPTVTTSVENRVRSIQQQITSRSRLERVIDELKLFPDLVGKVPMENLVAQVASKIQLEVRGTTMFRIYYEGTDSKEVATVANKLADIFITENTEAREQEARSTSEFLETELDKVKQRLDVEEASIAQFKREHMGELPEQRETNLRTLESLQNRLRTNAEALTRAQDRRLALEGQLAEVPNTGGTDVNQVALQLEQARQKLQALLSQYTEQHPEVALQRREIARLEEALRAQPAPDANAQPKVASIYETRLRADLESVELEIKSLSAEQEQIRADMERYQQRVENAPKNEAAMNALTRDYENLQANYQSLLNKKIEAKLAENLEKERQGEQFTIIDRAVPPAAPYKPNVPQIVMLGSAIGVLAGCAAAFALDLMKPRFRNEDELAAAYGIPVLASIPQLQAVEDERRAAKRRRIAAGSGVAGLMAFLLVAITSGWRG